MTGFLKSGAAARIISGRGTAAMMSIGSTSELWWLAVMISGPPAGMCSPPATSILR